MNCLSKEELIDHLFGLDRFAPAAAKEHLSSCPACRARLETLKRLKTAAASVPPAPVSGDFTARLMRELGKEAQVPEAAVVPSVFPFLRPAWSFGLAAFAAAACLVVFFLAGRHTPRAVPAPEEALYFADGPATANGEFGAPGADRAGFVYADGCAAARCGL